MKTVAGPLVSILLTTYQGGATIARTLESLAAQTLSPQEFEIVVVVNGPQGDTPAVLERFRRRHPDVHVRKVACARPGLSNARNLGMRAARGRYLTYVDDDDHVSATYLGTLLSAASPGVVPVAFIGDVPESPAAGGAAPEFANYYSSRLLSHAGRPVRPARVPAAISVNAGKLLPTSLARSVEYDTSLRSGEDFVYWATLFEKWPFTLHVTAVSDYAVYFRTVRQGSLGRQTPSYDFNVTQRLDCIAALERIPSSRPEVGAVVRAMTGGQVGFIRQFLREQPAARDRVLADVASRGIRGVLADHLEETATPG
jgi:glycosyltransferase involved in cell wall biosynthesis